MLCAAWPHVRGDLVSTRRGAAAFLDNLEEIYGNVDRQSLVTRWTSIGDAHLLIGDLNINRGACDEAIEAWLCALTTFEVARRLVEEDDARGGDVSARVESGVQRLGLTLENKLERVQIACCDEAELPAYYLPSGPSLRAPAAVICISREQETAVALLGRLLPLAVGRGISVLAVSYDDVSSGWPGKSEILLSCCLDYLSVRADVDAARIAVYGEGLSAVLATDFAVSDGRVAAAVCDGGLWNSARVLASIGWLTRTTDLVDESAVSVRRSRLVQQLECPVLVVAGGRGIVSVPEAIELEAECTAARIDLELAMPRMSRSSVGEIENFVTSDDCIFGWLARKLTHASSRRLYQSR